MTESVDMPIEWRLTIVMAERRINNKELALKTGLHHVTVSKHRQLKEMPDRLDKRTLARYCQALDCQPGDLMRYIPSDKDLE